MSVNIAREKLITALRENGWYFKRRSKKGKVEIYRHRGSGQRIDVPRRDLLPELSIRTILRQAGFTKERVENFLTKTVKD